MRSYMLTAAAALWLAPLTGLAASPAQLAEKPTCSGDYGTSILFEDTPQAAADRAKKEEKLVFVLHVSGHFEDPALT